MPREFGPMFRDGARAGLAREDVLVASNVLLVVHLAVRGTTLRHRWRPHAVLRRRASVPLLRLGRDRARATPLRARASLHSASLGARQLDAVRAHHLPATQ
jgi:hypothetical protein